MHPNRKAFVDKNHHHIHWWWIFLRSSDNKCFTSPIWQPIVSSDLLCFNVNPYLGPSLTIAFIRKLICSSLAIKPLSSTKRASDNNFARLSFYSSGSVCCSTLPRRLKMPASFFFDEELTLGSLRLLRKSLPRLSLTLGGTLPPDILFWYFMTSAWILRSKAYLGLALVTELWLFAPFLFPSCWLMRDP